MADDRTLPFKDRAYVNYQHATKRLEAVEKEIAKKDIDEIEDYRDPLSIDEKREITILLSWGGPSDGYKIYLNKDGEVLNGYYFFADWFEYEEFRLSGEELDRVLTIYPVTDY